MGLQRQLPARDAWRQKSHLGDRLQLLMDQTWPEDISVPFLNSLGFHTTIVIHSHTHKHTQVEEKEKHFSVGCITF